VVSSLSFTSFIARRLNRAFDLKYAIDREKTHKKTRDRPRPPTIDSNRPRGVSDVSDVSDDAIARRASRRARHRDTATVVDGRRRIATRRA